MKQPLPSGRKKGRNLKLSEVLEHFDDFKVKDPIAWVVGGIANNGSTDNDVDILINLPPEEEDSIIAKIVRFRISRSFPLDIRERIHYIYNDGAGPFTSNIPLFSLEAKKLSLTRKEMSSDSIKPLHFFKQLKAVQGRYKKDIFTIKALQEIIPEEEYPVEINQKYDGMRAQFHLSDGAVKFFSEEGTDILERFPTMSSQLSSHRSNIVLDVEITGAVKGRHMGRSDVAGYAHTKGAADDAPFTANVHDILFHNDKDLHSNPRIERLAEFQSLKLGNKFNIIPYKIAKNQEQLKEAVEFFSKQRGSEGAMIKSLTSTYELDGLTKHWFKFKKDFVIDAEVFEVTKVKDSNSYNYLCTIDDNIPIGRTYNTDIQARKGDIIQVAFGNLNKYIDDEKVWYNWVFPRVINLQGDKNKPDDIIQADLLNKESGGFIEDKPFPKRYLSQEELIKNIENYNPKAVSNRTILDDHRITHAWASIILSGRDFKYSLKQVKDLHDAIVKEMEQRSFSHNTPILQENQIMQLIEGYRQFMTTDLDKELLDTFEEYVLSDRKKRFVYQHHWRGKSVHGDLRFEDVSSKHLNGWTLMIEKEGVITAPIIDLEAAKAAATEDYYKIDYTQGYPTEQKIQVVQKGTQPLVWLTTEGKADPGTVGATREFPGIFDIVDKGFYELGADKPFFKEYFVKGKILQGRYVLRKLPSSGNFKDSGREPFVWYFWKTEEQTPYILSSRAIRKQDFPIGINSSSWLPLEIEKQIPKEFHWWNKDIDREQATELIKETIKYLRNKNIITLTENTKFILHRHWWKGQKVIRNLPVEHWDLRFSPQYEFTLDKNPLFDSKDINAIYRKGYDIDIAKAFSKDDETIKAGEQGNPNKSIDAHIEALDYGEVSIINHTEQFMSIELHGKHIKGYYTLKQTDPNSNLWVLNKGTLHKTESMTLSEEQIQQVIDLSDPALGLSRIEIANQVGCSMTAAYSWQKRCGL